MQGLDNIIDKMTPFGKNLLNNIIIIVFVILYLHSEFKENFTKLQADIDLRLAKLEFSLQHYLLNTDTHYTRITTKVEKMEQVLIEHEKELLLLKTKNVQNKSSQ